MGNKQSAAAADEPPPLTAAQHGLQVGDRVQTQWTVEEGGNDQWYPGTVSCHPAPHQCRSRSSTLTLDATAAPLGQVSKVLKDGRCKLAYADGDSWTGDARFIMRLTGSAQGPTVSTVVSVVPDGGPVLVAAPSIPQATVVPAQTVAVDAKVVAS